MSAVLTPIELPAESTEFATKAAGRKFRADRPHLRLVAPLRPERASRGLFAVIVTVALALGLIIMLLLNTSVAQTAFVVSELQSQQRELARTEASLTEAIAAAAAPPVLESKARALGMVPSTRPVFLTIPGGKVRGKAKPAPGDRTRTANVAASLTATLVDPLPVEAVVAGEEAAPAGQRRQIGDGAVLVAPGTAAEVDEATEQARKNEERQVRRETATTDGAILVSPQAPVEPEADGAQLSETEAR